MPNEQVDKKYTILWVPHKKSSNIAKFFNSVHDITLPYIVDSPQASDDQCMDPIEVNDQSLLFGLLVCYFQQPPLTAMNKINPYFDKAAKKLLAIFAEEKGFYKEEDAILAIVTYLRARYGIKAGCAALKAGEALVFDNKCIKEQLFNWEQKYRCATHA